ncbi:hypothetical protein AJ79_00187 [Helicocarpus griseus UAMH5409]|uniref:Protein kinase domain-containing protein n=1 Tax=Helicocarpus griseus UAMH5409 TaxID=1447875 RepID=A0A2B7Y3T9_9EURO|nr:hypothetical protein AJ79_00187 [Helicocarpus griseus UAMH5409]
MAAIASLQSNSFLQTYEQKLRGRRQFVACQCHNNPPEAQCTCLRYFVPMDKVVKWMEQKHPFQGGKPMWTDYSPSYEPRRNSMPLMNCSSHDDRSGGEEGVTYNLLLEFGERDLDEFWADLENAPPARTEEIICFWESLFDVAKALQKVHEVKNKGEVFDGQAKPAVAV